MGTSVYKYITGYCALIRAAIDYGSMVYSSASKTRLLKVEAKQSRAMRICRRATRSSPVQAVQVEVDEMPRDIRRLKLKMRYWTNIKDQSDTLPAGNMSIKMNTLRMDSQ